MWGSKMRFLKRCCYLIIVSGIIIPAHAASEPGYIPVGGMKLIPSLGVDFLYNDNIFYNDANKKSSYVNVVQPALSLQTGGEKRKFELSYLMSKGVYYNSRADDYLDQQATLSTYSELTRRLNIGGTASYSRSHDDRGLNFTGLRVFPPSPDKWHKADASVSIGYGLNARLDLTGAYSNWRYDNNRARTVTRDLDKTDASASFSYPVTTKISAVIEARFARFNYKLLTALKNLDSSEQRYFVGLNWKATAKTSGTFRGGYLKKKFAKSTQGVIGYPSWELSMIWDPLTYSTVHLATTSSAIETDGLGAFVKTKSASLSWDYQWSSRLSHTVRASYLRNIYVGRGISRVDNQAGAGVAVEYQMHRWLGIKLEYTFTKRSSTRANVSYGQNLVMLSLLGTL